MIYEKNTNKIYGIFLIMIIFFNERKFYLFNLNDTKDYNITIMLIIILTLISISKIRMTNTFELKNMIIIMFFMVLMTIVISKLAFNQPTIYIVEANRSMVAYILYFSVKSNIENIKNYNLTIKILLITGTCFALLATTQYLTYPHILLKGINFAQRFDGIRFYNGFTVVIPSFFILASYILKKSSRSKIVLSLSILLLEFFYLTNVTKTRNIIICIIIALFMTFLIQKKYKHIYKVIFFIFIIILGFLFFKNIINSLWGLTVNDTVATGQSRINTISYIFKTIHLSPILGLGMYSPKFDLVPYQVQVDVGLFGFGFEFGIVGLIWAMVMFIKIIKKIIYIYNKSPEDSYFFIGYFIYSIVILPFNCLFNYKELIVYFVIIYALLETKYAKVKESQ